MVEKYLLKLTSLHEVPPDMKVLNYAACVLP